MMPVDSNYVRMPRGYESYVLYYSQTSGFIMEIEGLFFPLGKDHIAPVLTDITFCDLMLALGKMWEVEYMDRYFLVTRLNGNGYIPAGPLTNANITPELDKAIKDSIPPKRVLVVYFVPGSKLGVQLINEEGKDEES